MDFFSSERFVIPVVAIVGWLYWKFGSNARTLKLGQALADLHEEEGMEGLVVEHTTAVMSFGQAQLTLGFLQLLLLIGIYMRLS